MLGKSARISLCVCVNARVHFYTRVCTLKYACMHLLLVKKIEIWILRIATNFHEVSTIVHVFCAPELYKLAHTQLSLFDLFDRSSLLESNKHIQWSWKLVERFTLQVFIARRDHFEYVGEL